VGDGLRQSCDNLFAVVPSAFALLPFDDPFHYFADGLWMWQGNIAPVPAGTVRKTGCVTSSATYFSAY